MPHGRKWGKIKHPLKREESLGFFVIFIKNWYSKYSLAIKQIKGRRFPQLLTYFFDLSLYLKIKNDNFTISF